MIVVNVQVTIKPERRVDFVTLAAQEAADMQGHPGCLVFRWSQDLRDGDTFVLYEEWEAQAPFEHYLNSDQFKIVAEQVGQLIATTPISAYYRAEVLQIGH